jgi:hypothetical protein
LRYVMLHYFVDGINFLIHIFLELLNMDNAIFFQIFIVLG